MSEPEYYAHGGSGEPPPGKGYPRDPDRRPNPNRYDRSPSPSHPYPSNPAPSARGYPASDYDPRDYAEPRHPAASYNNDPSSQPFPPPPAPRAPPSRPESSYPPGGYDEGSPSGYGGIRVPPPPSDYELGWRGRHDGRSGRRQEDYDDEDRYVESLPYDEDETRYPSRSRSRSRSRRRHRRRSRTPPDEKALGYPSDPKKGGRDVFGGSEGERGLGATLAGGAGGAWLGHEIGKGKTLETIAGGIAGAIAARAIERHAEKKKEQKRANRRSEDPYAVAGGAGYPPPGRGMTDVRDTGRDGTRASRSGRRSGSRRRRDSSYSSSEGYGRD